MTRAADPTRDLNLPRRELRRLRGGRDLSRKRAETALEERRKPKQTSKLIVPGTVREVAARSQRARAM